MDLIEMLILTNMLSNAVGTNPKGTKQAAAEADKENDTDIKCEIKKLRKERAEKLKEFEEKLKELQEIKSNIKAIELLLARLEKFESKINK